MARSDFRMTENHYFGRQEISYAANNGFQDRIRIIHEDLRRLSQDRVSAPVDWIVSNPPYRRPVSGRRHRAVGITMLPFSSG